MCSRSPVVIYLLKNVKFPHPKLLLASPEDKQSSSELYFNPEEWIKHSIHQRIDRMKQDKLKFYTDLIFG